LNNEHLPAIRLHATAVFGILNSFMRREDRHSRVIGTLLGVSQEGYIDVMDSFPVRHVEKSDEIYVAINKEDHKKMYGFHKRINRKEVIVGWYTTTLPNSALIVDNSSLIHEFYSHECRDPIQLVVDTNLSSGTDNIAIKAFISQPMIVGTHALANMFQEIKVEVVMSESEVACINHMIKGQDPRTAFSSSEIISTINSPATELVNSVSLLVDLVDKVSVYVSEVVSGKREADPEVGIMLADIMSSLQVVSPEDFKKYFDSKTQDMLMVSFLSTLTKTQLAVAERLVRVL